MKKVEGKTYLITGGSSGLGGATVSLLLKSGSNVSILDVNEEEGKKLCVTLDPSAKRVLFIKTDVTSEESVKNAILKTQEKFKLIHGVINCAGVGAAQRTASPRAPHDLELFKKVLDINLIGTFNVSRLVAHAMMQQKPDEEGERGVIINTASVAAYEGQIGQVAYSASKAGIVGMTIVMARDLSNQGIRVCTIAPGAFALLLSTTEEVRKRLESNIPFPKRLGRPMEFALLTLSIIQNPMLNGETIRLDGAARMAAL